MQNPFQRTNQLCRKHLPEISTIFKSVQGENKAASPQPPLKISTIFKSVQGGKKKLNRFVHAHLRFRVLNTKKSQGQLNHFFAV